MPVAHARMATPRAGRYLAQLCSHLAHLAELGPGHSGHTAHMPGHTAHMPGHDGGGPPAVVGVDSTETDATIRFADGVCTLRATAEGLEVRVEADDEAALGRLRGGIGNRLETIGHRDGLTLEWAPRG